MKIREMIARARAAKTDDVREVAYRFTRWAELALLDVDHVVELAMEECTIRALGVAYQVDAPRLLRAYRTRVRAAAWEIHREFEEALHDGRDPGDVDSSG